MRIALEAGPVEEEPQRTYVAAPAGEVWLAKLGGQHVALLQRTPRANPAGTAYRFSRESRPDPGARSVTFHGRQDDLLRLLPDLERQLGCWTAFAGIALHEVE